MRRISKYQGASTRSRLDRAQTARYYSFMIISNLIIFSLLSVFYNAIAQVVLQIVGKKSASEILHGLEKIPDREWLRVIWLMGKKSRIPMSRKALIG